jgi:hypothetical protein
VLAACFKYKSLEQVGPARCQLLMYADDVVLFAQTADEVQSQLDALKDSCDLAHDCECRCREHRYHPAV